MTRLVIYIVCRIVLMVILACLYFLHESEIRDLRSRICCLYTITGLLRDKVEELGTRNELEDENEQKDIHQPTNERSE